MDGVGMKNDELISGELTTVNLNGESKQRFLGGWRSVLERVRQVEFL
jgi:hypothetical protein